MGDALLAAVANRLVDEGGDGAAVARLGADEFVVVLRGCDPDSAQQVAGRLLESIRRPFTVHGLPLDIDASVGLAQDAAHPEALLRAADVAVSAAKSGQDGIVSWSPSLERHDPERLGLFGDLRRGIGAGELRVLYQPKADLVDGVVRGVEALVRWQHPTLGLLAPARFMEIAEATGLVRPLTSAVLEQAASDWRSWTAGGLDLTVAVNLSARSLLDAALPLEVRAVLQAHGMPATSLELELTETAAMQDPERARTVLKELRDLGIGLAVDDYGTGHASLSYLSRLPVTTLKIDRSFVSTMEVDTADQAIVRSTVDLAHHLGLRVVAEGVETRAAWDMLRALGCDVAQGYWLARPCAAEEIPGTVLTVQAATARSAPATR